MKSSSRGVMLTYDPRRSGFWFSDRHSVYTNYPKDVMEALPTPGPPEHDLPEAEDSWVPETETIHDMTIGSFVTLLADSFNTHESNSDTRKVRAIYQWLTSQKLHGTKYKPTVDFHTLAYQLNKLKEKENTYASLFALLCSHANIPCVIIRGHLKGTKYILGERVTNIHIGEWNSVYVNRSWRLLNPLWGSNVSSTDPLYKDSWYLFTDPEDFCYLQIPEVPAWQLTTTPIKMKRFESQAFLKQRFFQMNMRCVQNSASESVVETDTGEIELLFQLQSEDASKQMFECIVNERTDTGDGWKIAEIDTEDVQLDFICQLQEEETTDLSVKVRFPTVGKYKLELIGTEKHIIQTLARENKIATAGNDYDIVKTLEDSGLQPFDWVALYLVNVTAVPEKVIFFPPREPIGWGPGGILADIGLEAVSHPNGLIETKPEPFDMQFRIMDDAVTRDIKLRHMLTNISEGDPDVEVDECIHNGDLLTFTVYLDQTGEMKLMIFATVNGKNAGNVCNYHVICKEEKKDNTEVLERLKQVLLTAIGISRLKDLLQATDEVKSKKLHHHRFLKKDFNEALDHIKTLKKYAENMKKIMALDNNLIAELRSYTVITDPKIEHIMRATLVLLNIPANRIKSWEDIRGELHRCKAHGLKNLIKAFDINSIDPKLIQVAKPLLKGINVALMVDKSAPVAAFALWANGVISKYDWQTQHTAGNLN